MRAKDAAGNTDLTPASRSWTIGSSDTTPPETQIDSGPSGTTTSSSARFTFSSNEPGASFECALDGGAFAPCSSPKDYTGLALGPHSFQVRAIDAARNIDPTPASRSWRIEAAPTPAPAPRRAPGDYDGDGKAEIAVYRPGDGYWWLRGLGGFQYGVPGDVPVPADYDGDGRADITIYRPSLGTWYVHQTSNNADVFTNYGVSSDKVVPLPFAVRRVFFP